MLCASSAVLAAITPSSTSLMAHWNFDETSGSTAADHSGNNNHGTLFGHAHFSGGRHGNAVRFDGSHDYVRANNSASLSVRSQITIASWVWTTGNFGSWTIVGKDHAYQNQLISYNGIQNSIYDLSYGGLPWYQPDLTNVLTPGVWNHVVITFDGNYHRIYANGSKVLTAYRSSDINYSNYPLYIGTWTGNTEFFNGKIDEVGIWDQALDDTQIAAFYSDFDGNIQSFMNPVAVPGPAALFAVVGLFGLLSTSRRS